MSRADASILSIIGRLKRFNADQLQTIHGKLSNASSQFELTDAELKKYLDKRIHQNKANYDQQVKNMKPIVMKEALEFVKQQTDAIVKLLTKTHHNMVVNVMEFRRRNENLIEERQKVLDNWIFCEKALAHKSPTMEAEFALDETTPLSMYDCLVPLLKEQRRLKVMPESVQTIEDFRSEQ